MHLKYFGQSFAEDRPQITQAAKGGSLEYPHRLPKIPDIQAKKLNVVWIILDCLRSEAFSEKNMPNVWEFSKKSQVFNQHISGGNNTRMGIFGMFYGLNGTYWNSILAERRAPAMLDAMANAGYQFYITASASLTFPEFRHTAFVNMPNAIFDDLPGQYANHRDEYQVAKFKTFVTESGKKAPFFSMLLLDSTHSPYSYPDSHAVYLPHKPGRYYADPSEIAALAIVKNRYHNAVHFADARVGEVIGHLRTEGILESSVVIITGDHGEEFYEHGYFGHFTSFSAEQTHVPMILYVPGQTPKKFEYRTSHVDLPATMLGILGSQDKSADYTLGQDMFDGKHAKTFAMSCGWDQCALIDDDGSLVFGIESYNASIMENFDRNYQPLKPGQDAIVNRQAEIIEVLNQNRAFSL